MNEKRESEGVVQPGVNDTNSAKPASSPLKTRNDYGARTASCARLLDMVADRLESYGMREAAEKLDVISNTLEAGTLVSGEPYIVQQFSKAGFEVNEHPGAETKELSVWDINAPADKVFNVDGIELESLMLTIDGSSGHFYLDLPWPAGHPRPKGRSVPKTILYKGLSTPKTILYSEKEQEVISKAKSLLKPEGFSKSTKTAAAKYLDPSAEEMRVFLKKKFPGEDDIDSEAAIWWFGNDYHGGQASNLYSAVSTSKFKPSPLHHSVKDEGEVAQMMYDALEQEFSGKSGK